jgi:hypothetical protein
VLVFDKQLKVLWTKQAFNKSCTSIQGLEDKNI